MIIFSDKYKIRGNFPQISPNSPIPMLFFPIRC